MNQIKMSILLSQKAVKEAEDRKNELVMYLAHDIRTPLVRNAKSKVCGHRYSSLKFENEMMGSPIGISLDFCHRILDTPVISR